jgi:hypothetical protein
MLMMDPKKRVAIDDLLTNPLIGSATNRAPDLPEVLAVPLKDGPMVQLHADACVAAPDGLGILEVWHLGEHSNRPAM